MWGEHLSRRCELVGTIVKNHWQERRKRAFQEQRRAYANTLEQRCLRETGKRPERKSEGEHGRI